MTEHSGLPVHGYTKQSDDKIAIVNENKILEERLIRRCEELIDHISEYESCVNMKTSIVKGHPYDARWLRIAITHFQEGFMAMNRAIFNPERIILPEDKQ